MSKASTSTAQVRREPVTGRVLAPPDEALVSFKAAMASVVAAERDGFDAGYFGNPRQMNFASEAEHVAYNREFEAGAKQRELADAPPVPQPARRRK